MYKNKHILTHRIAQYLKLQLSYNYKRMIGCLTIVIKHERRINTGKALFYAAATVPAPPPPLCLSHAEKKTRDKQL